MTFLTDEIIEKNGRMSDVLKGAFVTREYKLKAV